MNSNALKQFNRRKKKLDNLIKEVESLDKENLKNELSRYICIRISGLIEQTVRGFYEEYAASKSSPNVSRYVSRKMKSFQNPDIKKVIDLARDFSEDWEAEISDLDDEIKDAVTSIVTVRHSVAHGGEQGMTLSKAKDYYRRVLKFLDVIQQQCGIN
ncbi:MAG: HEPN domain-containing protein [Cyanobacteria bacterium P01_G01_bin.54]